MLLVKVVSLALALTLAASSTMKRRMVMFKVHVRPATLNLHALRFRAAPRLMRLRSRLVQSQQGSEHMQLAAAFCGDSKSAYTLLAGAKGLPSACYMPGVLACSKLDESRAHAACATSSSEALWLCPDPVTVLHARPADRVRTRGMRASPVYTCSRCWSTFCCCCARLRIWQPCTPQAT